MEKVYFPGAFLIALLCTSYAFAQKEANNWPLSPHAGITFKSGEPEKVTYGNVTAGIVSSISDAAGNLLFYTDGNKVWDRKNREMPNGNGLKGGPFQNESVIVPKPGDPSRYFIFTTRGDGWGAPREAAHYSEVDLCLNNGMGDVIAATKNTTLMGIAARRTAAVKHANGIDYWVVLHKWESDAIYCYRVTSNGISMSPVISNTGSYLGYSYNATGDGGEMKFSPDGKRLAMVVEQFASAIIYDFNAQTGKVSNAFRIPEMYRQNFYTPDYTHGVEFSPDGQKLYMSRTNACLLLQYDLSAGNSSAILKSRTILAGDTLQHLNYDYYIAYGLQLGPNGKIYVAWIGDGTTGISVITKPNEKGLQCLYQHNIINWSVSNFTFGTFFYSFPTFVSSYFDPSVTIRNDFDCFSPTVQFSLNYPPGKSDDNITGIHWYFDDNASGTSNESTEISPSHTFQTNGIRTVQVTITWDNGTTQELKQLLTIPADVINEKLSGLGNDTTLCAGATLKLDASHSGGNVTWQDGSTQKYFDVTKPGLYWIQICRAGCSATDSISVTMEEVPDLFGKDTLLCDSKELVLDIGSFGEVIRWQDNSVSPVYTVTKPGTYWVNIRRSNCVISDSLSVTFCPEDIFIPNVVTANEDGFNDRFEIKGLEANVWSLTIYNRDGTKVYHARNYANDWTGANLAAGLYYYSLNNNSDKKSYKGWVQVIQ